MEIYTLKSQKYFIYVFMNMYKYVLEIYVNNIQRYYIILRLLYFEIMHILFYIILYNILYNTNNKTHIHMLDFVKLIWN